MSAAPAPVPNAEQQVYRPYCKFIQNVAIPHNMTTANVLVSPRSSRSWFTAREVARIYEYPIIAPGKNPVIGVMSFGGGLYGTFDSAGRMRSGDCLQYWSQIGITSLPTVVVKAVNGANIDPNSDFGGTAENTLDVQSIGGCCPGSNVTIILYVIQNSLANFVPLINYMLSTPVIVRGVPVKPTIISCSWGRSEFRFGASLLNTINNSLAQAVAAGVTVFCATGDFGSTNGEAGVGVEVDFPSSSPNVVACGGTKLISPNTIYDSATVETGWADGGGGKSEFFVRPAWQAQILPNETFRNTPDIASVADPDTGVAFIVNGSLVIYGGTSVSAPCLAGFLATQDFRSFLAPYLYLAGSPSFRDITVGNNGDYSAGTAYDNVTGLGSIRGFTLAGTLIQNTSPTSVTNTPGRVSLAIEATSQLSATVLPSNATNKSVNWSSSRTSVATVSSSGLVTAVAAGTATITAITVDGGLRATTTVTVRPPVISVTGVSVSPTTLRLRRGLSSSIRPTVFPSNAANRSVTWSTSNAGVATVSAGRVRGVAPGTATITVTTVDGAFTATCAVTVT